MSMDRKQKNGGTYCRPEKKGVGPAPRTSKKYCPDCKCRVRGENHESGTHHKGKSR